MKWILATSALTLSLGLAQVSLADTQTPSNVGDATGGYAPDVIVEQNGVAIPASGALSARELIGADVVGPDGDEIGAVDDLVLDDENAIEQVIIEDGAVLGLGGKTVALDFEGSALGYGGGGGADETIRVNMTQEALDQVAEFDKAVLETQGDRLASSYIERDVALSASDDQGEIYDLLMDQDGTVEYAIVEFGGTADAGDAQVAVDVDKLSGAPEGEPMQLAVTREQLAAAPRFDYRDEAISGESDY